MRVRPGIWVTMSGMALTLAGCGDGQNAVARAGGAQGATIEIPIPDAAPPTRTGSTQATRPDALPGEIAANPGATLATIGFPEGGAGLGGEARAALDRLAADAAVKKGRLVLRGHSDSEGDDAANRIMSRKRAEAVRDYLARKGLDRSRMSVIALGETRPIAPNARPDGSDDSAGRARNRRVEIELDRGA